MAFVILVKILKKDGWRRFYTDETPKLFEASKIIKKFLSSRAPKINKILKKKKILLEPLIASGFITLFSNLIDIESATKVMERFMFIGESFVIDTICWVFLQNEDELIQIKEEFML